MKYLGIESKINPAIERDAIVKFLNSYWDISIRKGTLVKVVDYILREGIKYGIALQEDKTEDLVTTFNTAADVLRARGQTENINHLSFKRTSKRSPREFTYLLESILDNLTINWQIIAEPKDYYAYCQLHADEEHPRNEENLEFDGVQPHSYIDVICFSFQHSLSKANVMYSDKSQGRLPLEQMVVEILHQGMTIGMKCVEQKYGTLHEAYKDAREEQARQLDRVLKARMADPHQAKEMLEMLQTVRLACKSP
ncbi:MAG: hypothetical protein HY438_03070 [DPANN group archaeon]|nr:hypothetical protein [DPANN group archaeon]